MSDSGSASSSMTGASGEARMLERRVSNNRRDLNGDQQLNYFIAWFNTWSELQKSDFVPVLGGKMSGDGVNGVSEALGAVDINKSNGGRPPSLFSCQIKLFHEWFGGWSDDQKNYLVMRLQDLDTEFFKKYEEYLDDPHGEKVVKEKDYFEPGIPDHLVRHSTKISNGAPQEKAAEDEDELEKKPESGVESMGGGGDLSVISE